jgi:hypothetical protein
MALVAGIVLFSTASAQDVVKLIMSDVYFQWKQIPKGSAMCGYSILGNHLSRDNPKIEWDINIDKPVSKPCLELQLQRLGLQRDSLRATQSFKAAEAWPKHWKTEHWSTR